MFIKNIFLHRMGPSVQSIPFLKEFLDEDILRHVRTPARIAAIVFQYGDTRHVQLGRGARTRRLPPAHFLIWTTYCYRDPARNRKIWTRWIGRDEHCWGITTSAPHVSFSHSLQPFCRMRWVFTCEPAHTLKYLQVLLAMNLAWF